MARLPVDVMEMGDRQVLPSASADQRMASAEDFGAGIGRAMQNISATGLQFAAKLKANKAQADSFAHEDQFIKLQDSLGTEYETKARGIAGSADGWWEGARGDAKKKLDEWVGSLPKDQQPEYRLKADGFLKNYTMQAFKDQFAQQDTHSRNTIDEASRTAGLQVQQNPDTFKQVAEQQETLIDKSTLPPEVKAQLKQQVKTNLAYTAELSRAQKNPAQIVSGGGNYYDRLQQIESGGNPNARNRDTGAAGLYQFMPGTARQYGLDNPYDPAASNAAVRRFTEDNRAYLTKKLGRAPSDGELYLAHQQGAGGAAKLLANPNAPAASVVGRKAILLNGGTLDMTAAQFANLWVSKFGGAKGVSTAHAENLKYLTPQQAAAVNETAQRTMAEQARLAAQAAQQQQQLQLNNLYIELEHGTNPQAALNGAISAGLLTDYDNLSKAEGIVKAYQTERKKGAEDAAKAQRDSFFNLMEDAPNPSDLFELGRKSGLITDYADVEKARTIRDQREAKLAAQDEEELKKSAATADAQRDNLFVSMEESRNPDALLRLGRSSGLITKYEDYKKARGIIDGRMKKEADLNVGAALVDGGVANTMDKNHRDGIEAYYATGVKSGAPPEQLAADIFERTGVVPPSFVTAVRGALVSNDPARMTPALVTSSNIIAKNPNAFAGHDGKSDIEGAVIDYKRFTQDLGMSSEQAVQRMVADAREPNRVPVKKEQIEVFKRTTLTQDSIEGRVKGMFSSTFTSAELPVGGARDTVNSIYTAMAEEGFRKYSDPDKALAYADFEFNKQFGVQAGVVTRYPPNKANLPSLSLPGADDGHLWINEQAAATVKQVTGMDVDPSQIVLVPVERYGVSTRAAFNGRPDTVRRGDGPDKQSLGEFQSVPYSIAVMPKDETQDAIPMNGVFYPDIETYVADKNKEQGEAFAARVPGRRPTGPYYPKPAALKTPAQVQQELDNSMRATNDAAATAEAERQDQLMKLRDDDPLIVELRKRLDAGDDDPRIVDLFKKRDSRK